MRNTHRLRGRKTHWEDICITTKASVSWLSTVHWDISSFTMNASIKHRALKLKSSVLKCVFSLTVGSPTGQRVEQWGGVGASVPPTPVS